MELKTIQRNARHASLGRLAMVLFGALFLTGLAFLVTSVGGAGITEAAYDGPGGIGSTDGDSSLRLWLKADDGVFGDSACGTPATNGGSVACWADHSGHTYTMTQSSTTNQPSYQTGVRNGQPVVRFSGADRHLVGAGATISVPWTVYAVVNGVGSASDGHVSAVLLGQSGNYQSIKYEQHNDTGQLGFTSHTSYINYTSTLPSPFGVWSIISWRQASDQMTIENGVDKDTLSIADDYALLPLNHLSTGTDQANNYYEGDIAEIMVYSSTLNSAQRMLVSTYLGAKYGIPVSETVYTGYDPTYIRTVAGIGLEEDGDHGEARSDGLVIADDGYLTNAGDYLVAGHNAASNSLSAVTDTPSGVDRRWARAWYLDKTDVSGNGGDVMLSFDFSEGAVGEAPSGIYTLLYRPDVTGAFSPLGTSSAIVDDVVQFSLDASALSDGYYTLGEGQSASYALAFDGVNDYVVVSPTVGLSMAGSSFTIEAWVWGDESLSYGFTDAEERLLIEYGTWEAGNYQLTTMSDGDFKVNFHGRSSADGSRATEDWSDSQWHHLAGVFDNADDTISTYFDGQLITTTTEINAPGDVNLPLYIGARGGSERFSDVNLDEIRIWNTARTAVQISENYTRTLEGDEVGLVAYYQFDQAPGAGETIVPDVTGNGNDGALVNMDPTTDWIVSSPFNAAPTGVDDTSTTAEDIAVVVDVLVNDYDTNGHTLSLNAVGTPLTGTAMISGTYLVYTPTLDFSGVDVLTYTVTDGDLTDTATVTVTVTPVNDAPVAMGDTDTTAEDTPVTVDVLTNDTDPENDILSINAVGAASHGTAAISGTQVVYTPTANYNGMGVLTYTVSDGNLTDTATVTVTVTSVNDVPTAVDDTDLTAEDTAVTVDVLANDTDVDGDALSISAVGAALHGAAAISDTQVVYTPTADYNGTDTFTYTASDGSLMDTATVTITVSAINDAPVAADDAAMTDEDTPVTVAVLANDTDPDTGTTLTVGTLGMPTYGAISTNGTTVVYTPTNRSTGYVDTFAYTVSDGSLTDTATVTITVSADNEAPIATDDTDTTTEDMAVTVDVLANDTDPDAGAVLTVGAVGDASHGTIAISGTRAIYSPAANYYGTDVFTYTVSDGGLTDTATVTITVAAVNDAPIAIDDTATTDEDTVVEVAVRVNDVDPDVAVELTVSAVGTPTYGSASTDGATVIYTPTNRSTGYVDTFTYTVSDGSLTDTATVTITVSAVNDAPTPVDDTATTDEDTPVTVIVLANDNDPDTGATLTVSTLGTPTYGSISTDGTTVIYTPTNRSVGYVDSFTYTVSDGSLTDTAMVTITVSADNEAPVAVDDTDTTDEDMAVTVDVLANDTDPDVNTTLMVGALGIAPHGSVSTDGTTVVYTPTAHFYGMETFTYTVSDGVLTDVATVTIDVGSVNDVPIAGADIVSTNEDTAVTIDVLANDSDADTDDVLSVTALGTPEHGTIVSDGSTITYTPTNRAADYAIAVSYTVSDGTLTDTGLISITVQADNDPPSATVDVGATAEDTAVTIDVLANDSDVEQETLTVASVGSAALGVVVNNGTSVTYRPRADAHGTDTFAYVLSDAHGGLDTANVVVTINPVNDAPVAVDDAAMTSAGTATVVVVLANDTDVDGDALAIAGVTQGGNGYVEALADHTVRYTPEASFSGLDSFSYTVTDGNGGNATASINVIVGEPQAGVEASDDIVTTDEDAAVWVSALANDSTVRGNLAVIAVSRPEHGTAVISGTSTILYTPYTHFHGRDSFTYTATDGLQSADTATVTVVIDAVNDLPDAQDDAATLGEDTAIDVDVLGNDGDVDGDTVSVSALGQPTHGRVVLQADGSLRYIPDADYSGPDSFSYGISDGRGGSDTATVGLIITPVNDAPEAIADIVTTDEDVPVAIDVLANDQDCEGDVLSVVTVTQGVNGTVALGAGAIISYTPNADVNGVDEFAYTIQDTGGLTNTTTVSITINAVEDPPEGVRDATILRTDGSPQTVSLGRLSDTAAEIDVLGNDANPDGAQLEVARVGRARFGRVEIGQDGKVKYTPDASFGQGTDIFTYTVTTSDKIFESIDAVSIVLNPPDGEVTAVDDAVTTQEDRSISFAVIDDDVNTVEGTELSLMGVIPGAGLVMVNADDTLTYYPTTNFNGTDVITYIVGNGASGADTGSITVTVTPVNDPPNAVMDSGVTLEDTPITVDVMANDGDVDGDPLIVVSVGQSRNGTVVVNADDTVTYTPDPSFYGLDRLSYVLRDSHGADDIGVVWVAIQPVNNYPEAAVDLASTLEDNAVNILVVANDFDADADTLTVTQVIQGDSGVATIEPDNSVTYTPDANAHGDYSFSYRVSDGQLSDVATVKVSVIPVNDPPVAGDDCITTAANTPRTIYVLANDADLDEDALIVGAIGPVANGDAVANADGTITYTPAPDFTGTDTFTYTVTDLHASDVGTITVTVGAPNAAPQAVDGFAFTDEDVPVTVDVLADAGDPNGDPLLITEVRQADHGVVSTDGHSIVYRPDADFNGTDSFAYIISDGVLTDTATVSVSVDPVNDIPSAVDDRVVTLRNRSVIYNVLSNDTDLDGDAVNAVAVGTAVHGTVSLESNMPLPVPERKITYAPAQDFTGTDAFTYTISDGRLTDTAWVTVTVNAQNAAPTASDDTVTTVEGGPVTVDALANDSDIEDLGLTISAVGQPAYGTATTDGLQITYTPGNGGADYTDVFTYTASDGDLTAMATVTVIVSATNDPPELVDDTAATDEDTQVAIAVLSNDSDPEAAALVVSALGTPAYGTVNLDGSVVIYTPANRSTTYSDVFTYTVSDGVHAAVASVTVDVTADNDPPVAVDDFATTDRETTITLDVLSNDTDVDQDPISVLAVGAPTAGTVSTDGDTVIYVPTGLAAESDVFTYTLTDGSLVDTATVIVTFVDYKTYLPLLLHETTLSP